MGASIVAYWPGITEAQLEAQPGFHNDDRAWGNMMAEIGDAADLRESLKKLKAGALLTCKTDGWDDEDVMFVTPRPLRTNSSVGVRPMSPVTRTMSFMSYRARPPYVVTSTR